MRVAVVTESFLPWVNGVTRSVLEVVGHLRRRGHEPLVIAPGAGPEEVDGVPVVRLPAVDLVGPDTLPVGIPTTALAGTLNRFRPDVVHLASPFVVGARGITAARRLGVPTVAVYQTDVAGFTASYGMRLTARAAWRWTRRLHARADRTLAPSRWAAEALRDHGVPRVHRWGRGVDAARFHPDRAREDAARALRAELAPHGELLVGYVGRLAPEKQVERLAALSEVDGVRVVVVGDGPARARVQAALPDAAFLGFRGGDDLATAYGALDVFCHTGPYETFCQSVQEAQASALPVLVADAGGAPDLVDRGRTGDTFPLDRAQGAAVLRARVTAWRDDPAARRAIGAAGRAAVAGRTWPVLGDELLGHYTDLLPPAVARPAAA